MMEMVKAVEILSIEWFSEYESYAYVIIDGFRIDKLRIIGSSEEIKSKMAIGGSRELLMSVYFDTTEASIVQAREKMITSGCITGTIEEIISRERIVINCGTCFIAWKADGFPDNPRIGDWLIIQGFFSAS